MKTHSGSGLLPISNISDTSRRGQQSARDLQIWERDRVLHLQTIRCLHIKSLFLPHTPMRLCVIALAYVCPTQWTQSTYSAVLKARVKFFSRSLALREEKSKAEGKKRWTSAQKARPSLQEEEKFSMQTPFEIWYSRHCIIDTICMAKINLNWNWTVQEKYTMSYCFQDYENNPILPDNVAISLMWITQKHVIF